MKKSKEYLKGLFEEPFNLEEGSIENDFLKVIKQVQIDSINETCKVCAKEAETKSFKLSKYSKTPRWKTVIEGEEVDLFSNDFQTKVNKQTIL